MNFKKIVGLAVTTLALNMSILGDINAASVDLKCEVRGANRSKISVKGAGLGAGLYITSVKSGAGAEVFAKAHQRPVKAEIETDYDSNPNDIAAGATAIPRTFIKNGTVRGRIYRYNSTTRLHELLASIKESCKAK